MQSTNGFTKHIGGLILLFRRLGFFATPTGLLTRGAVPFQIGPRCATQYEIQVGTTTGQVRGGRRYIGIGILFQLYVVRPLENANSTRSTVAAAAARNGRIFGGREHDHVIDACVRMYNNSMSHRWLYSDTTPDPTKERTNRDKQ